MSFSNHTFILKNDGTLWGCGANSYGQLGLGDTTSRNIFTKIINGIKSVYCGNSHTIILKNDGTLWACGYNNAGQLGLGDKINRNTFTQITTNTNDIKSVYCGYDYTFILKNDGTLWGCGYNEQGQLGLGNNSSKTMFTQITTNANNIKSICCGNGHTIMLKNDGTLWASGTNGYGQLCLKDKTNRNTFTQITTNANDVKSVYCGYGYTFVLKNDSTLWSCGRNDYGQLGLGDTTNRTVLTQITTNVDNIKSIYCGYTHTLILKNDSTLWGCGINNHGQLSLGDTPSKSTFIQITTNIKLIYCGLYCTLILKNDSTLWGCGQNSSSQLGLKDTSDRTIFTIIGINTNDIKCFANDYGIPDIIKIYDTKIGYIETLDTNNFRNIPVNSVEKLKSLCINPLNTHLNCLISFDKKQTWKTFNGTNWTTISDISPENIIVNGMEVNGLNSLDKSKLISGGFIGDLDFKVVMKTNDTSKTPSITKIYIEYK